MDARWHLSLIGYVIGKKPYYKPFIDYLYCVWQPKGNLEVLMRGGGFFVVRFSNKEDLKAVIEGGPWLMGGRPIVLRKWSRGMKMEMERLETIPIWIRFPQLPLHLWGKRMLSKLASVVGTPLYMDSLTATRSHIEFARICVEISASSTLPDSIHLMEDGILRKVNVEYEWKPSPCKFCNTFGHSSAQCALSGQQISCSAAGVQHLKPIASTKGKTQGEWIPVKQPGNKPATPTNCISSAVSQDNPFSILHVVIEQVHDVGEVHEEVAMQEAVTNEAGESVNSITTGVTQSDPQLVLH
ncbi:hypothetical protein QJS04_geneDACA016668 [Acorus gramineus]|uniref:DUF4283 domain-containing protein n=1 Tax=Acorus gramineus TaxID=55184 RepID=A0AAV9AUK5_ACOGR|nr:hypothetical protein QJS04_geneDACA016668 [Acorus gramineus]